MTAFPPRCLAPPLLLAGLLLSGCAPLGEQRGAEAQPLSAPPRGPFGYSLLSTEDGQVLDIDDFLPNDDCTSCHERQGEELEGSLHVLAHTDPLYRSTAKLALREAGPEVYTYCAACHSPQGVSTGLIPDTPEEELPDIVKEGVLCHVCHQVSRLTGSTGPWGEPGNASFVLSPDEDRVFGPPEGDDDAADHPVETREFLDRSEFCASCHTVIHPLNGLRLENTYGEWKASIYAEKGIQCQDCHMVSVEDAVRVAETLTPVTVLGLSQPDGEEREIHPHLFVGANANAEKLGGSAENAARAEARLRSATRLDIEWSDAAAAGGTLAFDVVVRNVGAGHSVPTGLTELREMWVDVRVVAADGSILLHSGALEPDGEIPDGAMRFGAIAVDAGGNVTYKPWAVARFASKRLVPPRGSERQTFSLALPDGYSGSLRIEARLFYRSASPRALAVLMGDEAFEPRHVEMARAEASVVVD